MDKDLINEDVGNANEILTLYHNTSNENALKIHKEGIRCGMRLSAYGEGSEAEGAGIWCSKIRGYGYGGATITFNINSNDAALTKQNDTEYIVYRDIKPEEIIDIDLKVSTLTSVRSHNGTVESDIPEIIKSYGKEKVINVFSKNSSKFVAPYDFDLLNNLINTGNKYCKGSIQLTESILTENLQDQYSYVNSFVTNDPKYTDKVTNIKLGRTRKGNEMLTFNVNDSFIVVLEYPKKTNRFCYYIDGKLEGYESSVINIVDKLLENKAKLKTKKEEASRNELLAKTKGETISRYNRAAGYKGFSITNIDTTNILRNNSIVVTCRVGNYADSIELSDILFWVQICAEENKDNQVNFKNVTKALMNSIDGLDIKVDCECGDWKYRMAYQASVWGYKFGKPENRPAKITNPNGYGALCKHLTALLSNKKWIQQVAGTLLDYIVKHIDEVNNFLKVKPGKELTLPNELARQNAKKAFYSKLFKNNDESEVENNINSEEEQSNE